MLMPSIFGENLFDEFFDDMSREMRRMDRRLYGKNAAREMKTDVHEHGVFSPRKLALMCA